MQRSLQELTFANWREWLHTRFQVHWDGQTVDLELTDAMLAPPHPTAPAAPAWESFSLCFAGPSVPCLGQEICHLKSDLAGEFDLFLVPLGPAGGRMRYQAVFNRLLQPPTSA